MYQISDERHYSLVEVAKILKIHRHCAAGLLRNEPGVIRIKLNKNAKRIIYVTPESVLRRIIHRVKLRRLGIDTASREG